MKRGSIIRLVTSVFDKHINRSKPIEDVPLWEEKYKVLKENIVVKPLNIIDVGELDENNLSRLPNSSNLFNK